MNRKVLGLLAALGVAGTGGYYAIAPSPPAGVIYGDEVRVRLYRGLGGRLFDRATDGFGLAAHKQCGVRYYVEGQGGMDNAALKANGAVRNAKFVVFVGTSMGGEKARDMAAAISPKKARVLFVDTVPWTQPIPKNVGSDHVVWRGIGPLGRGRPAGTINDKQHDRPRNLTHGAIIHSAQTHSEVVTEICRGITHPKHRKPEGK
jgi:hypothetical protein